MTTPTACLICEVPAVVSVEGLCAVCIGYPVLLAAFREGLVRRAARAPTEAKESAP
jgi:hypothetical protein